MTAIIQLLQGDNLEALKQLKAQGQRFDLVELDGPYMAGLEDWDNLSEAEYIQHYAERLSLVRDVLHPWGVVFVFGYPEGCAEIKSWAHRTGTLYLRRWLTWYKQQSVHAGRKVENILLFVRQPLNPNRLEQFGSMLKHERTRRGWTLDEVGRQAGRPWWYRGGNLYFETTSGGYPSASDLVALARVFGFSHYPWWEVADRTFDGLTEIDYLTVPIDRGAIKLNEDLRSKPVDLYLRLFKPTIPPTEDRRALILYGGSGNAGIAAAALGYEVTICETDPARCDMIRDRWDRGTRLWREKMAQLPLVLQEATQAALPLERTP